MFDSIQFFNPFSPTFMNILKAGLICFLSNKEEVKEQMLGTREKSLFHNLRGFKTPEGEGKRTTKSCSKLLGSESLRMVRKRARALGLRYRVRYSDSPGGPSDLLRREEPLSRCPLRSSDCNRSHITYVRYEPCTVCTKTSYLLALNCFECTLQSDN